MFFKNEIITSLKFKKGVDFVIGIAKPNSKVENFFA
jgi:hypothetical protein